MTRPVVACVAAPLLVLALAVATGAQIRPRGDAHLWEWRPVAAFGGPPTWFSASFTIGNKAYVGTGYGARNEFWQYDPGRDGWTRKADYPGKIRGAAIGFAIGEKGYLGLGYGDNERFSDLWEYDPSSDRWTRRASLPGGVRDHCAVFAIGAKAYVTAGMTCKATEEDCGELKEVWEYDSRDDRWTRKADAPEALTWTGYFVLNGKGYIGGGERQQKVASHFWEYDPQTDKWTRKAEFPGPARFRAVGFSMTGKGYIGTGVASMAEKTAEVLSDLWEYDPHANTWTQAGTLPGPARGSAVAFVLGSQVYVGTGTNAGRGLLRDFWRAEPRPPSGSHALVGPDDAIEAIVADVQAGRTTTPIIGKPTSTGEVRVTFLARSPGDQVPRLVSDVTGWGENAADNTFDFNIGRMMRVGRSDWYFLDARVARGARVEYLIVHGTDYRLDPYNPRKAQRHAGGPASEFVTPGYQAPEEFRDSPAVPAGKVAEAVIQSRALGGGRRVIVYTPPGYRRDGAYPLAVFQYGVSLAQNASLPPVPDRRLARPPIEPDVPPAMLDHLVARQAIEPIVAVFVESRPFGDTRTYTDAAMRTFLTRDVPAWVRSRYGVSTNADKRAILAISYGAKDALDAAVHSDTFGRLGLLIPGRRVALEPDLIAMAAHANQRLRVTILAGLYDHANLPTASRLRQAFAEGGHRLDYIEVAEGHTPMTWRNHMQDVLVRLFKPGTAD